ncbi:hypothetical protein JZ785_15625 [Alicyclobacillus curvatus]|nr:hypothetical protein JZ785_15625 [Alicyclobacillus curvatus]
MSTLPNVRNRGEGIHRELFKRKPFNRELFSRNSLFSLERLIPELFRVPRKADISRG